jgi:hypothetical protein
MKEAQFKDPINKILSMPYHYMFLSLGIDTKNKLIRITADNIPAQAF